MHHVIVIGDRFGGFARKDQALTVTQLRGWLRSLQGEDSQPSIHFGQGVSPYEHDLILQDLSRLRLAAAHVDAMTYQLAGRGKVHKYQENNVLVANLRQAGEDFLADLRIHNDNEILLDHQTGLHVQGMVVTEASRQMFLAVGEEYLAPSRSEWDYYYVIERMATTYENFLFPLRATLAFHTLSRTEDMGRVSVNCRIDISQAGRRCASTDVAFSAFAPSVLNSKEERRALRALDAEYDAFTAALV